MASFIDFSQSTTPTAPDTTRVRLFLNTSDELCIIKSDNTIIKIDDYYDKFIDLIDTPTTWGLIGEVPVINNTTDGLVFLTPGDGFTANFGLGNIDIARGDHNHDDKYYTKTELLSGSLNVLYYTENELQTSGLSNIHFDNITDVPTDITDLSIHSVIELNDITNNGSGMIITDIERIKLNGIEENAEVNNISDADANELTGGGQTTLHTHANFNITSHYPFSFNEKTGEGYTITSLPEDSKVTVATYNDFKSYEFSFKYTIADDSATHNDIKIETSLTDITLLLGKRFIATMFADTVLDSKIIIGEVYNVNPFKIKFSYNDNSTFPTTNDGKVYNIIANTNQIDM